MCWWTCADWSRVMWLVAGAPYTTRASIGKCIFWPHHFCRPRVETNLCLGFGVIVLWAVIFKGDNTIKHAARWTTVCKWTLIQLHAVNTLYFKALHNYHVLTVNSNDCWWVIKPNINKLFRVVPKVWHLYNMELYDGKYQNKGFGVLEIYTRLVLDVVWCGITARRHLSLCISWWP